LVLLVWAESLKDHCVRADFFGHRELAKQLWDEAEEKLKQSMDAKEEWDKPAGHLRASMLPPDFFLS